MFNQMFNFMFNLVAAYGHSVFVDYITSSEDVQYDLRFNLWFHFNSDSLLHILLRKKAIS